MKQPLLLPNGINQITNKVLNSEIVKPTLTPNMGTGGHHVPLIEDDYGIRKLTLRECFLFQGYQEQNGDCLKLLVVVSRLSDLFSESAAPYAKPHKS